MEKQGSKTPRTTGNTPAVKALDKKIVVRGTKFPSMPIEDAGNNPLLDHGTPATQCPKKKCALIFIYGSFLT